MVRIMGRYAELDWEEIDEFDTKEEAEAMLAEYRVAYPASFQLKIEDE